MGSFYVYPGQVFLAKHYDPFKGEVALHPFVCIYNQALDENLEKSSNIVGLLVTSQKQESVRAVKMGQYLNSFLDKESWCYCDSPILFDKRNVKVIGQLDSDSFYQIVSQRKLLLRSEDDQCVKSLMNMKTFEYKREAGFPVEKRTIKG